MTRPQCTDIDSNAIALRDGWVFNIDGLNNGKSGAKAATHGGAHNGQS